MTTQAFKPIWIPAVSIAAGVHNWVGHWWRPCHWHHDFCGPFATGLRHLQRPSFDPILFSYPSYSPPCLLLPSVFPPDYTNPWPCCLGSGSWWRKSAASSLAGAEKAVLMHGLPEQSGQRQCRCLASTAGGFHSSRVTVLQETFCPTAKQYTLPLHPPAQRAVSPWATNDPRTIHYTGLIFRIPNLSNL